MRDRKISLKREVLTDLTTAELSVIAGGQELLTGVCQGTTKGICVSVDCIPALPTTRCTNTYVCGS